MTTDVRLQTALQSAYGDAMPTGLANVDLFTGGLLEVASLASQNGGGIDASSAFGATLIDGLKRLRDGNRFHFENTALVDASSGRSVRYLSDADIASIKATRMADLLARNFAWPVPGSMSLSSVSAFFTPGIIAPLMVMPSPSASPSPGYTGPATAIARTAVINNLLTLRWNEPLPAETSITITFTFNGVGWFSIAFGGTNMATVTDCWLMRVHTSSNNGGALVGEVKDTKVSGYTMPSVDASQDVQLVSHSQANGVTTMTVKRALDTGDSTDYKFTRGGVSVPVMFAWSLTSSTYGYHQGDDATSLVFIS
jgi:DOMON domain/Animal haem peroxidase